MSGVRTRPVALALLIAVASINGCATKRLVSQWSNPAYGAPSFARVLVIGVTDQTSIRRNFEDRLTAELKKAGVSAVPSYRHIPEDGKVAEPRLKEAVKKTDADGVIISRLLRTEQRTEVTPGYYDPYPGPGLYGWYSSAWYRAYYTPPRVYSYPVYFSETTLHDVEKNEVIWSGTIRTVDPENADEAIDDYVQTVIEALKQQSIIRG